MTGRVPSFAFAQRAIEFSSLHSATVLRHQEQISSGVRFQRASDEPIAFRQTASLRSRLTELNADRSTIDRSTSILNASVTQVQDVLDIVSSARSLTQQGIQSLDSNERNSLAIEVDGLLDQLQQIGLATFGGRYLYGGTRSEDPPFEFRGPEGTDQRLTVTYNGSNQRSRASVGDSISVNTYYSGLEVFGSRGRSDTFLIGSTGARVGTGTDTINGQATLIVSHDTTSYLGGSGIQPGSSSAADDNIIGAAGAHTLTIVDTSGNGTSGTISLNGAEPIAFTNADTNLEITGSGGQVVFVDATNITAGFNGTVDIVSTGTLSVDGGLTEIPIDHSANQVVVDSETDAAVTIDSTQIRQTGNDHLEFPGTSDAFQVLNALRNDLLNTRGLDSNGVAQSLDRRLGELDAVASNALAILGEQSTSLQTLRSLGERVDDLSFSTETQISEIQSTDIPEAVLRLENSQALLQFTFAVTAEVTSLSLLDFLR